MKKTFKVIAKKLKKVFDLARKDLEKSKQTISYRKTLRFSLIFLFLSSISWIFFGEKVTTSMPIEIDNYFIKNGFNFDLFWLYGILFVAYFSLLGAFLTIFFSQKENKLKTFDFLFYFPLFSAIGIILGLLIGILLGTMDKILFFIGIEPIKNKVVIIILIIIGWIISAVINEEIRVDSEDPLSERLSYFFGLFGFMISSFFAINKFGSLIDETVGIGLFQALLIGLNVIPIVVFFLAYLTVILIFVLGPLVALAIFVQKIIRIIFNWAHGNETEKIKKQNP